MISHIYEFDFRAPIWYDPAGSEENPSVAIIKGQYLGTATSTVNDVTHHIVPVVANKKGNEVARGTYLIPRKKKGDRKNLEVIQRSYVAVRYPDEHAFKGIRKDSLQSWLYPRKLFPSRTKQDGTPWNAMMATARALDDPEEPELVKRAH